MTVVVTPAKHSPPPGKLVFAISVGDISDIYTANTDGSELVNLTNQKAILGHPVWSPDGKSIAYSSEAGISVMNADGSGTSLIPQSGPLDIALDWSPDGHFLLVETSRDVNREVYAVTLDGARWINLTQNQADDSVARWSPDGTLIAFASDRDSPVGKQVLQVYRLNINGGDVTRLTDFTFGASWPVWSPDGQELAVFVANNAEGSSNDVYILQADGTVIRKLAGGMGYNFPVDWSQDGKWVVINSQVGSNLKIMLEAVDGSATQVLNLSGFMPRWQPAGNAHPVKNLDLQIPVVAQGIQSSAGPLALINGVLIDGSGADPVPDAVVLIEDGKIAALGNKDEVNLPPGIQTIDLKGNTILPGFIDAHVHYAHNAENLSAWIKAGVTTVCDLGSAYDPYIFAFRDATLTHPGYSRIVSAGPIVTSPGGYPIPVWGSSIALQVTSPEDARQKVGELLDKGADIIKIAVTSDYGSSLTAEEITAITDVAHQRGTRVLAHVETVKDLELAVDNGVDIAAHMPFDKLPDDVIVKLVAKDVYIIPTAAVLAGYFTAAKSQILDNMQRFTAAGGKLALGDDYGNTGIQLGMPIQDVDLMVQAGMTPMEIIMAGTQYAAHACNLEQELGTLAAGKTADILVVQGNPLVDIHNLLNVQMVLRNGVIVWSSQTGSK
jgi:imidazolonepropionase-like amidohydrolase